MMDDRGATDRHWEAQKAFFVSLIDQREAVSAERMAVFSTEIAKLQQFVTAHIEDEETAIENHATRCQHLDDWIKNMTRQMEHFHRVMVVHNESYAKMHVGMGKVEASNKEMVARMTTLDRLADMIDFTRKG